MDRYLIVGLGNIGAENAGTRHNIGFDVVDQLALRHRSGFTSGRLADQAIVMLKGKELTVVKPTTFVNLSGRAVKYWVDQKKIPLERILVVLDDLALPLSKLRLRASGSDAGHNGLKSIQDSLETVNYPRLRFGIGNDYSKGSQVDFVLGRWTAEEMKVVSVKIEHSIEAIESFVLTGIERTMTTVNKKEFIL
ncbi:MAG TPA: aminoacyl-tRNA hydrolase [Flavitalea sp.]|nr:aminoacyl-tRNA hydrolase [Flavitalea sp.]